jgi:hypothetical protein
MKTKRKMDFPCHILTNEVAVPAMGLACGDKDEHEGSHGCQPPVRGQDPEEFGVGEWHQQGSEGGRHPVEGMDGRNSRQMSQRSVQELVRVHTVYRKIQGQSLNAVQRVSAEQGPPRIIGRGYGDVHVEGVVGVSAVTDQRQDNTGDS